MIDDAPRYTVRWSRAARTTLDRFSDRDREHARIAEGLLNRDPTPANPFVADLSADEDAPDESHILWWRNITLHYRFTGTAAVEIDAVRAWSQETLTSSTMPSGSMSPALALVWRLFDGDGNIGSGSLPMA